MTLPTLQVRPAEPDEFDAVAALTAAAFEASDHRTTPAVPSPARVALMADAAGRAASGDLLVATDGETLLGTASLLRAGTPHSRLAVAGEAELKLLAVAPQARRRGAATALMREAIRRAGTWEVERLVLDTAPWNRESQQLYLRLGFERVPERETLEVPGIGRLHVYSRKLHHFG